MRLSGRSSESRNRRSDPQFSEEFSNSAATAIRSFYTYVHEQIRHKRFWEGGKSKGLLCAQTAGNGLRLSEAREKSKTESVGLMPNTLNAHFRFCDFTALTTAVTVRFGTIGRCTPEPTRHGMSRRGKESHVIETRRRLKLQLNHVACALLFHNSEERAIPPPPPPPPCPTLSRRLPGRCLPWILISSNPRNLPLGRCANNLPKRMFPRCSPNMLHLHQDTPDRIPLPPV